MFISFPILSQSFTLDATGFVSPFPPCPPLFLSLSLSLFLSQSWLSHWLLIKNKEWKKKISLLNLLVHFINRHFINKFARNRQRERREAEEERRKNRSNKACCVTIFRCVFVLYTAILHPYNFFDPIKSSAACNLPRTHELYADTDLKQSSPDDNGTWL